MKPQPQKLRNQLRISVADARLGMFIAELDRPWSETPFMLQGFLLVVQSHLDMLHDFVSEVTIDPTRSATDSLTHLPWDALHETLSDVRPAHAAAARDRVIHIDAPARNPSVSAFSWLRQQWRNVFQTDLATQKRRQPAQYYLRYSSQAAPDIQIAESTEPLSEIARKADLASKLTPPSSLEFSRFIESIYPRDVNFAPLDLRDRLQLWWSRRGARLLKLKTQGVGKRAAQDRPNFLPDSIPLVIYHDQATIAEESVRAKRVVQQADTILEKIVNDIQADLPISLDDVRPVVDVLVESVVSNPMALMWSARMHDQNKKTYMHGLKVAIYMMALGRHLGFPKEQLSELGSIGLLLDIGMLKLPAEFFDKAESLTEDENELLTQHVAFSMETLEQSGPLPYNIARGIKEHHERIDGSGYPQGLKGDAISIQGRMAAIADSFAAMTAARPYDVTHSAFDALKELFKDAETKLHAPLVEQFVQAISIFPVGSLIELSSGEVAIVIEHNKVRRLEPLVLILTDGEKEFRAQPFKLDLMARNKANREHTQILRGLPDGAYDINYRDYYLN